MLCFTTVWDCDEDLPDEANNNDFLFNVPLLQCIRYSTDTPICSCLSSGWGFCSGEDFGLISIDCLVDRACTFILRDRFRFASRLSMCYFSNQKQKHTLVSFGYTI